MAQITIDIPEEVEFLKKIPKDEWPQIAVEALQERIDEVANYNRILAKSKATEKDVEELTEEIKEGIWKRHLEKNDVGN